MSVYEVTLLLNGSEETIEQNSQLTERDLIVNLAKKVAELKRELIREQEYRSSIYVKVSDLRDDVADLEDRLDENEKDTEEVIGRMNDLGDGIKEPRHERGNLISELDRRRHEALCKRNKYEDIGDEVNYRYYEGKAVALIEVIGIVREALRNG